MATPVKKKMGMFTRIESREDAVEMATGAAKGFLFLAVLQAVVGMALAPAALLDAAVLGVLGLILLKSQSRVGAVLLLLVSLGEGVVTVMNRLGMMKSGGNNIILAVIMVIVGVRAVEATFKLHGQFGKPPRTVIQRKAA
ncbi:MAG TPA: hypothetical protein VFZ87_00830 [Gemmatimonadales bacterium]